MTKAEKQVEINKADEYVKDLRILSKSKHFKPTILGDQILKIALCIEYMKESLDETNSRTDCRDCGSSNTKVESDEDGASIYCLDCATVDPL